MAVSMDNLPAATDAPEKKSTRGRKPGSVAKVRAELPPEAFVMEEVKEDERGTVRRIRVERTPQQIAIDKRVLAVYREWVADGRPTKWTDMPVKNWPLDAKYVEDALFFLGKAATLHGVKLVIGNVSNIDPITTKPYPDGKTRIPFCVIARAKKTPATPAEIAPSESE